MPELLVVGIIFIVVVFLIARTYTHYVQVRRLERARINYEQSVATKYELQNIYDEFGKGDDGDRNPLVQYHDEIPWMQ